MPHCAAKASACAALRCGACGAMLAGNIGAEVETFIRENKVWLDSRRYSAVPWHSGLPHSRHTTSSGVFCAACSRHFSSQRTTRLSKASGSRAASPLHTAMAWHAACMQRDNHAPLRYTYYSSSRAPARPAKPHPVVAWHYGHRGVRFAAYPRGAAADGCSCKFGSTRGELLLTKSHVLFGPIGWREGSAATSHKTRVTLKISDIARIRKVCWGYSW